MVEKKKKKESEKSMKIALDILKIIVGFVLLIKGADFFVDGASAVAKKLGVPELVIGLTIVALGTSAPEAAVSISAALKGNNGISIGNIVGSNIFNILFILGMTSLIIDLPYLAEGANFVIDGFVMLGAALLLYILILPKKKLTRFGGIVMLLSYLAYFLYLLLV